MTTATGTFTSCGGGQLFSLTYQCTGPSCTNLNGFPNTTCTTDGTTLQCSNGVTCPGSANYTSTFNFLQENVMVTSNQVVKTNCGDFTVTSDGTTGGTKISITDTTNACAPDTSLNSTGTGPSSIPSLLPTPLSNGTNGTATTLPSPPAQSSGPIIFTGAAASYRSPTRPAILCLLLLAISLLVQGTTAFHQQSGQLQASPKEARGTELDLSFAVPAELEVRELDARDLSTLYSDFAKNFAEYLANKITNAANSGGKGDVFANNLIAEISEAVCDHFVGGAISNVLIGDLVEECIAAVYTGNALVAPELEFLSIFGAALLCNAAVNEIIPQIGDLTDALCKGPKPCGNLLTDPNNCGACGNVCSTGVCKNGACTSNTCTGQTCSSFGPCGPGGTCVCATTAEGTGYCVDGNTPCSGLPVCSDSKQCQSGDICAVASCCPDSVCVGATFCGGDASAPHRLFRRDGYGNSTIAEVGSWVM